jgi:hypothetical protein
VGVEKLFPAKFAKIKSRQEALKTTFSVFVDIFYPPSFSYFEENGSSTPTDVSTIDPQMRSVGFMLYRGHPIHS